MSQVVQKSAQQVMDAIVRFMVRQRRPCIRRVESSSSEDEFVRANFNMNGDLSPLLCLLKADLSLLKKWLGYEFLQSLDNDHVYWTARKTFCKNELSKPLPDTERDYNEHWLVESDRILAGEASLDYREKIEKLVKFFEDKGFTSSKIGMICLLDDNHKRWAREYLEYVNDPNSNETSGCHLIGYDTTSSVNIVSYYFKNTVSKSSWDDDVIRDSTVFNPYP